MVDIVVGTFTEICFSKFFDFRDALNKNGIFRNLVHWLMDDDVWEDDDNEETSQNISSKAFHRDLEKLQEIHSNVVAHRRCR